MSSKDSKLIPGARTKIILWIVAWLFLIALSLDFYNWGKKPDLLFGVPMWLWAEVGLVLLIALTFGILVRFTWNENTRPEESGVKFPGTPGGSGVKGGGGERGEEGEEGFE